MANDRLAQAPVEIVLSPTDAEAQFSQAPVEVIISPTDADAQAVQLPVEVVISLTSTATIAHGDLGLDWAIDAAVSQVNSDLAIAFQVTAHVSTDLPLDYQLAEDGITQVGADLEFDYILAPAAVGANLTFSYKVTKPSKVFQRGADLRLRYRILTKIIAGVDLQINWIILPATAAVGSDFDFNSEVSINNLVGVDLDFTYELTLPRVRTDLTFDYAVTQAILGGVNLQFDAPVHALVLKDVITDASIRMLVTDDITIDWVIGNLVNLDLSIDALIRMLVTDDIALDWVVLSGAAPVDGTMHWYSASGFAGTEEGDWPDTQSSSIRTRRQGWPPNQLGSMKSKPGGWNKNQSGTNATELGDWPDTQSGLADTRKK